MGGRVGDPSDAGLVSDREAGKVGSVKPYYKWGTVAGLLIIGGVVGAVLVAGAVARASGRESYERFRQISADIASTLQLAIQHQDDLVVNGAAFIASNPDASNMEFVRWARSVRALERYPELQGIGEVVIVSAAQLPAFAARVVADPPHPLGPDGRFHVVPPGDRPSYCFSSASFSRAAEGVPAGFDFCATNVSSLAARDTGQGSYEPFPVGGNIWLGVESPVYRGGLIPPTVAGRRAAFQAWLGVSVVPGVVLERALQGHAGTAVTLRYHAEGSGRPDAVFSAGNAPSGARSATIDLRNGWTVQTFAAVAGSGLLADPSALGLLISGVVLSLLLGVLVFVLGTGRARALRMVLERTAQLRGAQAQLVDAARQAGMAEIAVNVLHNVGNVLNSVNVSADLVCRKVRGSKSAGLAKAVALMREHDADLGDFLTTDSRGRALPGYLDQLATTLAGERESLDEELMRLTKGVEHIKEIVSAQQSLAGVPGVLEPVRLNELFDDALRMSGILDDDQVRLIRDVPDAGSVSVDRHRVLLVLLNLIANSIHAMKRNGDRPRELYLQAEMIDGEAARIRVVDNGEGIAPENLTRIFEHGFTTHADGHGFGLHSSALAAIEMGGTLSVHSDGPGAGAAFTLQVPVHVLVSTA